MNTNSRLSFYFIVLTLVCIPVTVFSASSEELKLLGMYYESKDLAFSTTRSLKPISRTAENITVITAEDIRAMNAHTVAEVLNQVPGMFINFNRDFGGTSFTKIQGAETYHTLVLVDGIRWNSLSDRTVETNGIPMDIIERIEIIKGPGSSAWGSSLGGVVNIITRQIDTAKAPSGTAYTSFGERNTYDVGAGYEGKIDKAKFYIYGGRQESDGLRAQREFENDRFFSKISIPVLDKVRIGFSMGYTEPDQRLLVVPIYDFEQYSKIKSLYGSGNIDAEISDNLKLTLSVNMLKRDNSLPSYFLSTGEFWDEIADEEKLIGTSGLLTWTGGSHTLTLGMDKSYGDYDAIYHYAWEGAVETDRSFVEEDEWAVFVNDTLVVDKWSFTPGVRYDHNSIFGSFISPSIGATYEVASKTILRGCIARGFTAPALVSSSVGNEGWGILANPDLNPEKVWSYQAGVESGELEYFYLKSTIFYHKLSDEFVFKTQPSGYAMAANSGSSQRRGMELEVSSIPWHNVSLGGGMSWVRKSPDEGDNYNIYSYNIKMVYKNNDDINAQLLGQYIQGLWEADEFIWDLNLSKRIFSSKHLDTYFTTSAHNLFNGQQYDAFYNKNPERWLEAGLRVDFN